MMRHGFLAPYRVLDVTDHRGVLAGHMLAQLGADVVQVEPCGGTSARRTPPFADAWPSGEDSLYWAAYGSGKRSVVCDPSTADGDALWARLLASADILIDSAAPGDGRPQWLDPVAIAAANPGLIHVSITPFGLTGPKRDWADSEITLWAAGGPLLLTRTIDGSPVRISVPQAYLHGAAAAAGAALVALAARNRNGVGQHVDLAVADCIPQCTMSAVVASSVGHPNYVPRPVRVPAASGPLDLSGSGSLTRRSKWQVADGMAEMHLAMGPAAGPSTNTLFAWMRSEGAGSGRFADWDWTTLHVQKAAGTVTDADIEAARAEVAAFLATRRRGDLMVISIEKGVRIAPIETIADLAAGAQFAARGFYREVRGAGGAYQIPGPFAQGAPHGFADIDGAPRLGADTDAVAADWAPRPALAATPVTNDAPLAGLKVLDLAWVVAGPLIGRTLADFGATVIRVESSKRVETARLMGPFPGGAFDVQASMLYETCNAGKLGLSLDLSKPEARAVVRDLAAWADVVIESFTPGQMARWGLDHATLAARNPGLVMVSTSLAGQTGPFAAYSGYGNHGAAIAGFQNIVGPEGGPIVGPYGPYTDFVAPRFALTALLAALDHKRRTGEGCHLDVSQTEAGVQFLAAQIADHSVTGRVQKAAGNRDAAMAPHGVFACAGDDDWVAIAVRDDAEWGRLAGLIGGAAQDARFATFADRKRDEAAVEALVTDWTAAQTAAEAEAALQAIGVAAHRLTAIEDFAADPQVVARGHLVRLPHALGGEAVIEASPFRLSRTPARYARSAPSFGRDNAGVLDKILKYDAAAVEALKEAGALE